MVVRLLESTRVSVRAWEAMYNAVVQSVLLYGIKSWVVTGDMLKVLEGFHHQSAQRIKGMMEKRGTGKEWE